MLHRTLLRNVNGHREQGSSNSSSINPVQKHNTQNNVSRPPANTILDMAKKIFRLQMQNPRIVQSARCLRLLNWFIKLFTAVLGNQREHCHMHRI